MHQLNPAPPAVLVLDFDGTVYVGDAAVWAYADQVIERAGDSTFADHLRLSLTAWLGGESGESAEGRERGNSANTARYLDGYAAVAAIATDVIGPEELQAAYLASRQALVDGSLSVTPPEGLADFLSSLESLAHRVLVTNAPLDGVAETLARLGLDGVIDHVEANAHKPWGFDALLPALLGDRAPHALLSVGDIWTNDIQPPLEFGCATAFIDRFGHASGPAHLHAPTFPELYRGIGEWAANPSDFQSSHPLAGQRPAATNRTATSRTITSTPE